ncbi:uncharacterized protein [Nicotiana tomentosiformis]|uniref:uncharacterized protein n=1 Tax=Nicotiana tomentosiformis TaxID=4098 RepID=UPI00388CBE20
MGRGVAQPANSAATTSTTPPAQGTPAPAGRGADRDGAQNFGGPSRFYAMRRCRESEASPDVVTGILSVQSPDVYALIDPGSTLSYITPYIAMEFGIEPEQLHESFSVSTAVGKFILAMRVYRDCVVTLHGRDTMADLTELKIVDFDVVFPDELPGIPPDREIDFGIDVMSDMHPISIPPYRIAPTELKELKEQLRDLLEKVSSEGIKVDPQKISAVKNWPRPTTPTKIHSFLGLAGYNRKFVEGFSTLASPLTKLTQKVVGDPSAIVLVETIEVNEELSYGEIPVFILDRQVRKLRNKEIASMKVLWRNQQVEEPTWRPRKK